MTLVYPSHLSSDDTDIGFRARGRSAPMAFGSQKLSVRNPVHSTASPSANASTASNPHDRDRRDAAGGGSAIKRG